MINPPDEWLDHQPDPQDEEDEEIIWVSKSEIKRDAEELKRLGMEMMELSKNELDRLPLDEELRDRLIENGDSAMDEVIELYPAADRQQLRSLIRNAQKEKATNKPPKSSRQIFQYLRELAEA